MTGDKSAADCIDFVLLLQKKGTLLFLLIIDWQPTHFFTFFQDVQYRTLLQAIADIKAAIRYVQKRLCTTEIF